MFEERIGREKRITRKLKELQVALALENTYTKDQILEAYINQINYDRGWYGIQTASRNYFGKNATELNPAEAAMVAARRWLAPRGWTRSCRFPRERWSATPTAGG